MAKINRYNGNYKAFASEQQTNERTVFGQLTISNELTNQLTPQFLRGWGIVGPSDSPSLQDFNAAMFTATQSIAYLHQMGIAEYNAAQEYYSGSITQFGGVIYISLQDGNTGRTPSLNPAWWRTNESPAASNTVAGIQRNATQAEVNAGTSATLTVTPLTLAARLVALVNSLSLGTAAAANVTTSQNDLTAGRVLKVGDYGWGGSAPSSTNIDTITTGGTYSVGNTDSGTLPVNGMIGTLFHMERNSSGMRAQLFISNLGAVYTRSAASSVWRAWSEILRGMPALYKSGFSMSNNSANPAGKVDVSVGFAKDTGNSIDINLSTPITGILVGPWTAGNDQNKLDSGTRTANTWYHLYAVRRTSDGQGDIVFSTSASSPAANAGYSGIRRIGSVKTDAANNIIPFFNAGNFFCWKLPIRDAQVVGAGTSPSATITTSTPSGVPVLGQFEVAGYANGTFVHLRSTGSDAISIPALTNNAGWLAGLGTATESTVESVSQETNVLTNSSSQIVFQGSSATSMTYSVTTKGWWEL